jgi:hypothetical protein
MSSTTEPSAASSRREPGERRAFRRAPLDRPVLLETSHKTITARSVNVSGGGLALRTELDVRPGERVSVYFELPIGYGVETGATVVRREGDLTVLRFVDGPSEAILAIRAFCRVSGLQPAFAAPRAR